MTTEQKQLVKATVPVLQEHGLLLTKHFYQRMFEHNPELKNIFNMGNQQNERQQTALAMAVLAYAQHIDDPSVLFPVVDQIGHKHTSLQIRPEHYDIVGKHLIASIKEVLQDAATPELLEAWSIAYGQLAALMSGHEQNLYKQKVAQHGGWTGFRPFIVKKKVKESQEITSFYLYPADGGAVADFKAGQFVSLRVFLPELNLLQPRQYSISCAPNGSYYRISVKKEAGSSHPDGLISNHLHNNVEVGQTVDLSSPSGVFFLQDTKNKNKVFISGGVGQTPLLSMVESLLSQTDSSDVAINWIHGCRNQDVHAFKAHIDQLAAKNDNLTQHVFYDTVEIKEQHVYDGWVDLEKIKSQGLLTDAEFYICGPSGFINKHFEYLTNNNVARENIHYEEFGPASLAL